MLLKDVIGQADVKKLLRDNINTGRISHAQLFEGAEGTGNLPLALAYVQYLFCKNKTEDDACGTCNDCHKIQKLIHPDVHLVFPVNSTKKDEKNPTADTFIKDFRDIILQNPYMTEYQWYLHLGIENKQGNISKYEAEEIIRKMNIKPFEAQYGVIILWLPERMNVQASNMLLKLVEEPPENKLFIMVTQNANQIIATIRSRTQRIKIPRIDEASLAKAITDKLQYTPEKSLELARVAQGSYSEVLNLVEMNVERQENFENFRDLMRLAVQPRVEAKIQMLKWAEKMAKYNREQQKSFCVNAQRMIRENLMLHQNLEQITYLAGEELEFSRKFSPYIHFRNSPILCQLFNDAHRHIIQNGNGQIIFTDLVLKMGKLISKEQ